MKFGTGSNTEKYERVKMTYVGPNIIYINKQTSLIFNCVTTPVSVSLASLAN